MQQFQKYPNYFIFKSLKIIIFDLQNQCFWNPLPFRFKY